MVGMFETTFQHASSTAIPHSAPIDAGLSLLHDFETIVRLSPDCRGCKPIQPPPQAKNTQPKFNGANPLDSAPDTQMQYYEVEDDLPFIPKRLWTGGVKYTADFLPTSDGCDITVHAPGGFTSTNHWKLLRSAIPGHAEETHQHEDESKDLLHVKTDNAGGGWYVQIISDAKCPRAFAGFVKGFLKNSHTQLQQAYIDKLVEMPAAALQPETVAPLEARPTRERRPTLGRRRSSIL